MGKKKLISEELIIDEVATEAQQMLYGKEYKGQQVLERVFELPNGETERHCVYSVNFESSFLLLAPLENEPTGILD